MTQMGLDYLRHQEQRRSNLANETETNRANLAKEAENLRHNTATEQQAKDELSEANRHNVQTETLESIKNQAMKEHYVRQDANQITAANIKAKGTTDAATINKDAAYDRALLETATKYEMNLNDNQTKRVTELSKLMPKSAQWAVAKAYAKEDPIYKKNLAKAQGASKDILMKIALGVAAPQILVQNWKNQKELERLGIGTKSKK